MAPSFLPLIAHHMLRLSLQIICHPTRVIFHLSHLLANALAGAAHGVAALVDARFGGAAAGLLVECQNICLSISKRG